MFPLESEKYEWILRDYLFCVFCKELLDCGVFLNLHSFKFY